jgi:uncharacterized protein YoxC
MNLDTFFLSLVFDNAKTKDSANKVEQTVNTLTDKVLRSFARIEAFEFLKNAIEQTITLTTKLDNLAHATNENVQSLNAWGEAVKRTGGTTEGFYSSISNLAQKLRDVQTNFGSSGQLVFARLGLNLQKSNGQMKTATELLGDIGDKFKNLPKVWQLNLGQQLGLDQSTIRLLSSGSKSALELVDKMRQLGAVRDQDTEKNIRFRNSLYDIQLIWQSIKITIANGLIPVLTKFSDLLVKSFRYMQEHAQLVKGILIAISALMAGAILNSIVAIASAITTRLIPALIKIVAANPWLYALGAAFVAVGLLVEDFVVYLRGGKSAFEDYYKWIGRVIHKLESLGKVISYLRNGNPLKDIFGLDTTPKKEMTESQFADFDDNYVPLKDQGTNKEFLKNTIASVAKSLGFDPSTAVTIANIESGLDPNAKSKTSSASGLFQTTDETFLDQVGDLSNKNDPMKNSLAGIMNLKSVSKGLSDFLGRKPTGGEVYLGERFGLEGAKKLLSSNPNSMASSLLSSQVLRSNADLGGLSTGQIINNANKSYASHAVSVGNVSINVHAPNANPSQVGQAVMQQFNSQIVTNRDNGVRQ